MNANGVFIWLLIFSSFTVFADEEVFLGNVPSAMSNSDILNAVSNALQKRMWQIASATNEHIYAEIEHKQYKIKIKFWISEGKILFDDEGSTKLKNMQGPMQNIKRATESEIPSRWLEYLRRDVKEILHEFELNSKKYGPQDIQSKLEQLIKLKDSGLITEEEFQQKRKVILDSF